MIVALLLAIAQVIPGGSTAAMAPPPAPAPAPATRLNLDTPIEAIAADAKGKAVLDADLPTLASNPAYDSFKAFSLNQLHGYAPDKLTDELLAKAAVDLAAVK